MQKLYGAKPFAVRIVGSSMINDGIVPGSTLVVRRSSSAKDGDIVIAAQDGGVTCARKQGAVLVKASDVHKDIPMTEDCKLLGVVKAIFRPKT
mgnify:CR=1 FL=1